MTRIIKLVVCTAAAVLFLSTLASGQAGASSGLQCYQCYTKGCETIAHCGKNQHCMSAIVTTKRGVHHSKQCVPSIVTCHQYEKDMRERDIQVDRCRTCTYNLCNSFARITPSVAVVASIAVFSSYVNSR